MEEENIYDELSNFDSEYFNNCLERFDRITKSLWDEVIVPYLRNYKSNYILDKLTENDYDKFYELMVSTNPLHSEIVKNKKDLDNEL